MMESSVTGGLTIAYRAAIWNPPLRTARMGPMLIDGYGRAITNLRISVTDRCNLRCVYCMPAEPEWMPQPEILRFEEIGRLVRGAVSLGITDFPAMARTKPWQIRYIEFMPLDGDNAWTREQVVTAKEILAKIHAKWPLDLVSDGPLSDPARIFRFKDGLGDIGIIASVSEPFCFACDPVRITPDGKLRTCLFSTEETDIKGPMGAGADGAEFSGLFRVPVGKKMAGQRTTEPKFLTPALA